MAIVSRWSKPLILSLIFHVFLLTVTGALAARLLAEPQMAEQFIELELAHDLPAAAPGNNMYTPEAAALSSLPQPSAAAPAAPAVHQPMAVPTVISDATASAASPTASAAAGAREGGASPQSPAGSGNSAGKKGGISAPSILSRTEAVYPDSARQAALQGTVVLKVQVLDNGRAGAITVSSSSGHDSLDQAAAAAVKQWRFVPAKDLDNGQPIITYTTFPVSFRLN